MRFFFFVFFFFFSISLKYLQQWGRREERVRGPPRERSKPRTHSPGRSRPKICSPDGQAHRTGNHPDVATPVGWGPCRELCFIRSHPRGGGHWVHRGLRGRLVWEAGANSKGKGASEKVPCLTQQPLPGLGPGASSWLSAGSRELSAGGPLPLSCLTSPSGSWRGAAAKLDQVGPWVPRGTTPLPPPQEQGKGILTSWGLVALLTALPQVELVRVAGGKPCLNPGTLAPYQSPRRGLRDPWPRCTWREQPTSHCLRRSPTPTRALPRAPSLAWAPSPWSMRSPQRLVTSCICPSPSGPGPSRPGAAR
jgi:hypothetical protein